MAVIQKKAPVKKPLGKSVKVSDIYDIYAISYIIDRINERSTLIVLADILQEITNKLLSITRVALGDELIHVRSGCDFCNDFFENKDRKGYFVDDYNENNKGRNDNALKKINTDPIKTISIKYRRSLSFELSEKLFRKLKWGEGYGGKKWANIAKAAKNIEKLLPVNSRNIKTIVSALDHLIDLEHNNALYLNEYCSFCLEDILDKKKKAKRPSEFLANCSKDVKDIYKEFRF